MSITEQQIRDLVEAALRRDPEEREAYLEVVCAGNPELRAAVAARFDEEFRTLDPHRTAFTAQPATDQAVFHENETIGPYIVRGELGRGGMGIVYLADDTRLSRRVALKAIAPHLTNDPSARERLRREARIAAGLSHPGIATVYALEEIGGNLYLACEYVPGQSLRAVLQSGPCAMTDVVDTASQLARALATAHAHGVTHRDLKPENIIRTPAGVVKILDFGLARSDSAFAPFQTQTGVITGTPAYMAPEQARGEAVDFRTDLFAFGVIVYEMASGVNPFAASTLAGTISRILQMEPAALAGIQPACPPALEAIVATCLRKAAEERYANTDQLVAELSAFASGGTAASASNVVAARTMASGHGSLGGWWTFHHAWVMAIQAIALYAAWQTRAVMPQPHASRLWLAALACVIAGASLRLHLLFMRRVHPDGLVDQFRRSRPWLRACEVLLCGLLLVFAVYGIGRDRQASVTTLVVIAAILLIAAFVIEPATVRAALLKSHSDA